LKIETDKIPLRGCMNPDAENYVVSFISQMVPAN